MRSSVPSIAKPVRCWLLLVWALILAMVLVGGVTRLTGSGLSITEWRPLMGAIPPLDEADWRAVFAKYEQSPEYHAVNHWMALADFKRIFFWEYLHRLLGRLVGAVVLLPWLYFVWRKLLPRALSLEVLGVFALGGLQGLLGWYMVRSGLIDEPRVSHYRLAAHLLLAFATGQLVLWLALDAACPRDRERRLGDARLFAIGALLALLVLQVIYGAFMAGTHAGYYSATFPDMNGSYSPKPFFTGSSPLRDAVSNPLAIHYLHRSLAWLVLGYAIALCVYLKRKEPRPVVGRAALLVAAVAFVQLNLGAITVLSRVALPWAVAHQAAAYLLVSSVVLLLHRALGSGASVRQSVPD
jgi:cytochrome c oxidase assembly protein subunit 15